LKGGKSVSVTFDNGETAEVFVSKLKLAQYDDAFKVYDKEMELTAFICGRTKNWILGTPPKHENQLTEESYELLVQESRAVNEKGFFVFAQREQEKFSARMRAMPASLITAATQALANRVVSQSPLNASLPASVPTPV